MRRPSARTYRMERRAESAAETRQRLVEATAALHSERGIQATSLRDIAERAGVSVGTAYHHFPTYDAAIRACGHYTQQLHPLPDALIFDGVDALEDRVAAFVAAMAGFCGRAPWIESIRADRDRYEPIAEGIGAMERGIESLARVALRLPKNSRAASLSLSTLIALTDPAVFRILRERGVPRADASAMVTRAVLASLPPIPRRRDARGAPTNSRRRS